VWDRVSDPVAARSAAGFAAGESSSLGSDPAPRERYGRSSYGARFRFAEISSHTASWAGLGL
jgi:hypothetical protein